MDSTFSQTCRLSPARLSSWTVLLSLGLALCLIPSLKWWQLSPGPLSSFLGACPAHSTLGHWDQFSKHLGAKPMEPLGAVFSAGMAGREFTQPPESDCLDLTGAIPAALAQPTEERKLPSLITHAPHCKCLSLLVFSASAWLGVTCL